MIQSEIAKEGVSSVERRFRVVFLAGSSASVKESDGLLVGGYETPTGFIDARLWTHFTSYQEVRLPQHLVIELEGPAASLHNAMQVFTVAAHDLVALVATACNAAIDEPVLDRGYETTRGALRREFFQNLALAMNSAERRVRSLDRNATSAFLTRALNSPFADRVVRAARQYRSALVHFHSGGDALAVAHLFMGVEAITNAILEHELSTRGVSEDALAAEWELDLGECEGWRIRRSLLEHARRRLVFQSDSDTHRQAKLASDGLEHGFKSWQQVGAIGETIKDKTARYLREAILHAAFSNADPEPVLFRAPFDFPARVDSTTLQAEGFLCGKGDLLIPAGSAHPGVVHTELEPVMTSEGGRLTVEHRGTFKVHAPEGMWIEEGRVTGEAAALSADDPDVRPVRIDLVRLA